MFDKSVSGFGKGECHGCSTFGPAMLVDGQQWYPWVVLPPSEGSGRSFSLAAGTSQLFILPLQLLVLVRRLGRLHLALELRRPARDFGPPRLLLDARHFSAHATLPLQQLYVPLESCVRP